MIEKNLESFNWQTYENWDGKKLITNKRVKGQDPKTKVYSHEPYAQEMFDLLNSKSSKTVRKDLQNGDIVSVVEIPYLDSTGRMTVEIFGGLTIDIDLGREKRFIQLYGFDTVDQFIGALTTPELRSAFVGQGLYAYVIESSPSIKVSLWQGHLSRIREEFMSEISSPSKAYVAKVIEANRGGFFVEVQGIDAFMPGSLAAPNKIIDFHSYVGKEVVVMIEDYLKDMKSFIVSHKKYIEHVLPRKLAELSLEEKHTGRVTGTSKYGIFVEFGEIFTGLLHRTKMKEDTLDNFNSRSYSPGDEIDFYIGEVTKDNRIILTEESPEEKRAKVEDFSKNNSGKGLDSIVAAVMAFGVIINIGDLSGVVPNREFRKVGYSPKTLNPGDPLIVELIEVKEDDKMVFGIWTEDLGEKEI